MKKGILITAAIIFTFILGYSLNNIAISEVDSNYKVAVVDIQKIVANSQQVKNLKKEQEQKMKQMQATINKAQLEISKETDKAKIAQLEDKYREQLNTQKLAMDYEYNSKLTQIDNEIKSAVVAKAREMNYQMVLPKNMTLFGGDDITEEVSRGIK
ncbi:OmpH family outer membrane protein [bacterium]|nr:OmpH family outer membrane protein [bacterium]